MGPANRLGTAAAVRQHGIGLCCLDLLENVHDFTSKMSKAMEIMHN